MLLPAKDAMTSINVWTLIILTALVVGVAAFLSPAIKARLSKQFVASAFSIAALLSSISVGVTVRVPSGTGWHTAFGYPRTFYFVWESFENNQHSTSFSLWRFLENSLVYVAFLCLLVVLYHYLWLSIKRIRDL